MRFLAAMLLILWLRESARARRAEVVRDELRSRTAALSGSFVTTSNSADGTW